MQYSITRWSMVAVVAFIIAPMLAGLVPGVLGWMIASMVGTAMVIHLIPIWVPAQEGENLMLYRIIAAAIVLTTLFGLSIMVANSLP